MIIKTVLIFLLIHSPLQALTYGDLVIERNQILNNQNILKEKEIELQYKKYMDEQREKREEEIKKAKEEEARKIAAEKAKKKAQEEAIRIANEKFLHAYDDDKNDKSTVTSSIYIPKGEDNPLNYKGQPELKLGTLHIYGIKSIAPFKDNKVIIKAANGTFGLPKEKFEEAEKINFSSDLLNL